MIKHQGMTVLQHNFIQKYGCFLKKNFVLRYKSFLVEKLSASQLAYLKLIEKKDKEAYKKLATNRLPFKCR